MYLLSFYLKGNVLYFYNHMQVLHAIKTYWSNCIKPKKISLLIETGTKLLLNYYKLLIVFMGKIP